ncbi:MAG: hypothetical protein OSB72_09310 [Gammaproteobacteria bacterium]|nr:hypothetical protein [Gammaproteobacteria bacterium]
MKLSWFLDNYSSRTISNWTVTDVRYSTSSNVDAIAAAECLMAKVATPKDQHSADIPRLIVVIGMTAPICHLL